MYYSVSLHNHLPTPLLRWSYVILNQAQKFQADTTRACARALTDPVTLFKGQEVTPHHLWEQIYSIWCNQSKQILHFCNFLKISKIKWNGHLWNGVTGSHDMEFLEQDAQCSAKNVMYYGENRRRDWDVPRSVMSLLQVHSQPHEDFRSA